MNALVVGGTGPTGPYVVQGLLERRYEVAVFHRGTHEAPLPDVEHIHGDPHFPGTIDEALRGRSFDVVVAAYGRVRYLAEALAGRCRQFIAVGGVWVYAGGMEPGEVRPAGMPLLAREDDALVDVSRAQPGDPLRFAALIRSAEDRVFELGQAGAFAATYFRYPALYGPRQVAPWEWSVIRRALDRRPWMALPDNGLAAYSRCAARNAAHALLLAVDQPAVAAGRTYNCADDRQFSLRQWAQLLLDALGCGLELVSLPASLVTPEMGFIRPLLAHSLVDTRRIRDELGYRDVVDPRTALDELVAWHRANPLTPRDYPWLTDAFDYEAEERLLSAYRQAIGPLVAANAAGPFVHPYPHPGMAGHSKDHRGR